jgi:subtilase family serine protease
MRSTLGIIPVLLLAALCSATQADRITSPIDTNRIVLLKGNVHSHAQARYDQGRVDAGMRFEYITMQMKPSAPQQAALDQLLQQQQDPSSPNFHKWLTPEQYADRFGLSPNDVEKVSVWLRSQGFTIVQVARGRDWIAFSGNAALVENAFHTEIHYYNVDGEMHHANATPLSIPQALGGVVAGFGGLHDFSLQPMGIGHAALNDATFPMIARPLYNLGGSNFLAPGDIATIYNISPLYTAGITGTGIKMVVVGQVDVSASLSDIDNFRSAFGLAKNDPKQTIVGGTNPGTSSGDMGESKLDLEWAGAVAQNASILFITAAVSNNGVFAAAQYAVDNKLAPVISMSYGGCESSNAGFIPTYETDPMQKASAFGITFVASSGDTGAAACDAGDTPPIIVASQGLSVNYPASSPEVTGVGGNEFNEGSGTYWNGSDANGGTAVSYIPEMAWNDTTFNGTLSASGGGASSCGLSTLSGTCTGGFPKPSWQTGTGVPADSVRDVPDVAMSASADHDGYIVCDSGSCASGIGNSPQIVGGTSASAPVFGGIVTLLNQFLGGSGLGNINSRLYQLAQNSSNGVFHDVTTGNNIVPCANPSPNCPTKAPFQFGYSATKGYDQVTGLGSLDAHALATNFSVSKIATSVALSAPPTPVVAGTSVRFTATVSHTSGTTAPTGTVKFNNGPNDSSPLLGTATLASNGTANFMTSLLAGGTYSVTATYEGDATYAKSAASPAVPLSVQDFQISGDPTTVTVSAPGQSGTTTLTITPLAGFSQTLSYSCSGLPSGATCTFAAASATSETVTIATTATSAKLERRFGRSSGLFYALLLPGLCGLVVLPAARKRGLHRIRLLSLIVFLACLTLWMPACGGGNSSGGGGGNSGTPTGTSTATVTAATSGASPLSHSTTITLTVQ